jgi:hypothetical protein
VLADEFLPFYDVSDAVATVVEADVVTTWDALMEVDLIEVGRTRPMVGFLGALRALPELVSDLLHGELPQQPPKQLRLRDTTKIPLGEGGWVLLGEQPHDELALGLVGKFWRPVIHYAQVTPESFREFADPGYAKTVYSLSVRALDEQRTLLSGVMRTATTDEQARKWFRRYWTLGVGSGAHIDAVSTSRHASWRSSVVVTPGRFAARNHVVRGLALRPRMQRASYGPGRGHRGGSTRKRLPRKLEARRARPRRCLVLPITVQEETEPVIFGVRQPYGSFDPVRSHLHWLLSPWKDAAATGRLKGKLKLWFMPTGWRPTDVQHIFRGKFPDLDDFQTWRVESSRLVLAWALMAFAILAGLNQALYSFSFATIVSAAIVVLVFVGLYLVGRILNSELKERPQRKPE